MPQDNTFSERIPPQALEAEQSVLGAMLLDKTALATVQTLLKADDFYAVKHQQLYAALVGLARRGLKLDLITVQDELRRLGQLEDVGGLSYLTTLVNLVPTTANVEQYAQIVEQKATLRRLQSAARAIVDSTYTADDAELALAQAGAAVQQVTAARKNAEKLRGFEGLCQWISEYATSDDTDLLPTGLDDLDEVLEIRRGECHGLMGPPKMGKSTLARQIAYNQALDGLHVLYASLEEPERAQKLNFLSLVSGFPKESLRRKWLKPGHKDWNMVEHAAGVLEGLPIKFDYTPLQTIAQLTAKIRYYDLTWGLDMVFIDTGQAMGEERRKDERGDERYVRMVREFEAAAKAANCAVIMVIQGKQDVLDSDSYWLTPNSISDARGMVQAFTSVIGVMRPEKVQNPKSHIFYGGQKLFANDKRWKNIAALFTVANRNGEENLITPVYADMQTGLIANLKQEYWPWKAPEEQIAPKDAWRTRKKREAKPAQALVQPVDAW